MTIVANFLAGPGAGKSSMMHDVMAQLKWSGISCEMAPEWIKESAWEGRKGTFEDQFYIFGKQHYRIQRLIGEVDIVLTDSPLILSASYGANLLNGLFAQMVRAEFEQFNNALYYVQRIKQYDPKGRNQTLDEAKVIDGYVLDIIQPYDFMVVNGTPESAKLVAQDLMKRLSQVK